MIAYNKPVAYDKTFVQVCGIKIKDSIEKRCLRGKYLKGKGNGEIKRSHAMDAHALHVFARLIGHYPVAASLCFKARLSTKPKLCEWFFFY